MLNKPLTASPPPPTHTSLPIVDEFDDCKFIANGDRKTYGSACDISGNGIVPAMTADEKKGLIAEIMKLMLEMYYSK